MREPFIYISAVHQEREVAGSSDGKGERRSERNLFATRPVRWLKARGRLFITATVRAVKLARCGFGLTFRVACEFNRADAEQMLPHLLGNVFTFPCVLDP